MSGDKQDKRYGTALFHLCLGCATHSSFYGFFGGILNANLLCAADFNWTAGGHYSFKALVPIYRLRKVGNAVRPGQNSNQEH